MICFLLNRPFTPTRRRRRVLRPLWPSIRAPWPPRPRWRRATWSPVMTYLDAKARTFCYSLVFNKKPADLLGGQKLGTWGDQDPSPMQDLNDAMIARDLIRH